MACATLKRNLDFDPLQQSPLSPRPNKRRRYNNSQNTPSTAPIIPPTKDNSASPFDVVELSRVSNELITSNLREEMRRLQHRKQLHFGGEISNTSQRSGFATTADDIGFPRDGSPSRDKPLFTFRQVGIICERLLREREDQLRETYEQALSTKLSEQYDTFVKFTYDQIQKSFEGNSAPSYLS